MSKKELEETLPYYKRPDRLRVNTTREYVSNFNEMADFYGITRRELIEQLIDSKYSDFMSDVAGEHGQPNE